MLHPINCIWQGLLTGIVLSLMLGTVFFSLIRNSIAYGYKTGMQIALGVVVCDIMFISLALWSQKFALFLKAYQESIAVGGGLILLVMGIYMFIHAKPQANAGKIFKSETGSFLFFMGNGFLLNVLNPVNFFSWLAISSFLTIEYNYNLNSQILYFTASLVSIFLVEVAIAYFAFKLKTVMTDKIILRINQTASLVFIGLGIRLLFGIS